MVDGKVFDRDRRPSARAFIFSVLVFHLGIELFCVGSCRILCESIGYQRVSATMQGWRPERRYPLP